MTRLVLGQSVVYRCDGPHDEVGGKHHAVKFVPLADDALPTGWYALENWKTGVRHFCDTDCLRERLQADHEAFLRQLHEELEELAREEGHRR
jgi:hypothetical protein